jgi:uncharacterized membrane protein
LSTIAPAVPSPSTPKKRIIFLDVLRAYAIMMMLQGHFVDTMLGTQYKNPDNPIYSTWFFFRGMTAPIFFFVSGAIFVFLMLKDSRPWQQNVRVQKGFRRVALLLFLGYALKWNIGSVLILNFFPSMFVVDVFHIIGLAILMVILVFILHKVTGWSLPLMYLSLALGVFIIAPDIKETNWSFFPIFLQNYLIYDHGSTFIISPWIGFSLFGGVLGWHMHTRPNFYHGVWAPIVLLLAGLWLHFCTPLALSNLYNLTHLEQFKQLMWNNTPFWRLGHVMVVFAVFIWLTRIFNKIPGLIMKVGSETLVIYSVHYVLLYGTWFGVGIANLGRNTWNPWMTALGAMVFVASFVYLIYRIEDIRRLLYEVIPFHTKAITRLLRRKFRRFCQDNRHILETVITSRFL